MRFITISSAVLATLAATVTALDAPAASAYTPRGLASHDSHLSRRFAEVVDAVYARGLSDGRRLQARDFPDQHTYMRRAGMSVPYGIPAGEGFQKSAGYHSSSPSKTSSKSKTSSSGKTASANTGQTGSTNEAGGTGQGRKSQNSDGFTDAEKYPGEGNWLNDY
ncbi:hypothetical protein EIP91_007597 [Steccherinum ochraceum]|uniref:Uncharacterized protein n=1 Tax=Steccherinum ochraceum TaxID=92696 RepID=A0A4R0RLP2_9APHY|nr:hypothetical protein EIP91_007597 [Steccherinum ochraceum]